MRKWQFMWRVSIGLTRLCLFAVLGSCSVDLSNLGSPPHNDAATSSDTFFPVGRSGGAGGNGGAQTGGNAGAGGTGGGGGARADAANPAVDAAAVAGVGGHVDGATDGTLAVAEDGAPTPFDSAATDRPVDFVAGGGDDAEDSAAAPEVGAADVRDLGTDRYEAGGEDGGDAGCLGSDCVPFIVPSFPDAMRCNLDGSTVELAWSDFSAWDPTRDSRLCGNAGAYHVQGTIAHFRPGLQVLADVYAAEDSTWHPISGGPTVKPNAAGSFEGDFCLPQKGLDRTFRFRVVQSNTAQDAGVACLIHVK